ncbi:probable serine/threonine-protein kinase cdc7 [Microplitis mediator]|uniref:probable serine/threonine-protein kinase cdc7 n=1 Tax=Microplitis mediator TaxID=375433 RepID=UPI002557399C|nr:probable serine/threonine-protein kinase cdc7 [Microplitis mediator]
MCTTSSSSSSSSSAATVESEDIWNHIFSIFGEHPMTLDMTEDGVWVFQLTGIEMSIQPTPQHYRLIDEEAVSFSRRQAMRHLSSPAPPLTLSKTLSDDDEFLLMGEPLAHSTPIPSSSSSSAAAAVAASQSSGYPESSRLSSENLSVSDSEQLQQNAQGINELLQIREQLYHEILHLQQQQYEQAYESNMLLNQQQQQLQQQQLQEQQQLQQQQWLQQQQLEQQQQQQQQWQ